MEPNTQPNIEATVPPTAPNKNKKMLILLAVIIVIIIVAILLKSKVQAPAKIDTTSIYGQTDQIVKDISDATTFDNESDLIAIDKEFLN